MKPRGFGEISYQVVIHVVVGIVVLSAVVPVLYVLGTSLTTEGELMRRNYFVFVPHEPTLEAYNRLLNSQVLWRALGVSVLRTVLGPLLTIVITILGAYALSRPRLPGRGLLLMLVVATILFRGGMIPNYLVINELGLLDSVWSLVLPLAVDGFGLLVIKMFIENIPREIMDSAAMDGAGEFQLLFRIIIPLAAPAIAAITMFNVVAHWVSWFDALIYIRNQNNYPLPLVLRSMLLQGSGTTNDQTLQLPPNRQVSVESLKMAMVVLSMMPILLVYPFLQRHFVKGVYLGAVK